MGVGRGYKLVKMTSWSRIKNGEEKMGMVTSNGTKILV